MEQTIYHLDDGSTTTIKSQYMRQEFQKNRTRREIADELNVKPGIVAQATANMRNTKLLDRSRVFLTLKDGRTIPRADYIREQVIGQQRPVGEVANELKIKYDIAYAAVKGLEGVPKAHGGKVVIEIEGEKFYRVDYIRKRFNDGLNAREIVNEITEMTGNSCDYAIVYSTLFRKNKKKVNENE